MADQIVGRFDPRPEFCEQGIFTNCLVHTPSNGETMTGPTVTLGVLDGQRKEINIHGSYFHCLSSVPAGQINAKAIESSFFVFFFSETGQMDFARLLLVGT